MEEYSQFDEAGFKVRCVKGEEILVPLDIYKVYSSIFK
jgi:hypothetical protein